MLIVLKIFMLSDNFLPAITRIDVSCHPVRVPDLVPCAAGDDGQRFTLIQHSDRRIILYPGSGSEIQVACWHAGRYFADTWGRRAICRPHGWLRGHRGGGERGRGLGHGITLRRIQLAGRGFAASQYCQYYQYHCQYRFLHSFSLYSAARLKSNPSAVFSATTFTPATNRSSLTAL